MECGVLDWNHVVPPHFSRYVMEYVIKNYQERWIGRDGTVAWPAQSHNFKLLDSCLWDCMQSVDSTTVTWKWGRRQQRALLKVLWYTTKMEHNRWSETWQHASQGSFSEI